MVFENNAHGPAIIVLILFLALLFGLLIYYFIKNEGKYKKVLRDQALKRNGIVSSGLLSGGFTLNFEHNLNQVKIWLFSSRNATRTYFEIKLYKKSNQNMLIYKETFLSKVGKKLGMEDIEIGYDGFDKEVILKGSDENFIRKILTYNIQEDILKTIKKYSARIYLKDDFFQIMVPIFIKTNKSFDEIMDLSLRIVDKINKL